VPANKAQGMNETFWCHLNGPARRYQRHRDWQVRYKRELFSHGGTGW
jgi:hypothetical protein